jgi:hypothetical protein
MRAVEVQRATAHENAAFGFGNGEVADVLANFGEGAAEEGAVAGETVDQLIDVCGVLETGFTHEHGPPPVR